MNITSVFGSSGYEIDQRYVRFKARNSAGSMMDQEDIVPVIEAPTSEVGYITSFVSLEHPSGKWWESLFIPVTRAGTMGVSITTWGRAPGQAGSIQAKIVSESEWYSTAQSKFGSGGYGVLTYAGRESGMTSSQSSIIKGIKPAARSVPIGVLREHEVQLNEKYGPNGVIQSVVENLNMVTPIEWFLTKAYANGKSPLKEVEKLYDNMAPQNRPPIEAAILGLNAMNGAIDIDDVRKVKPAEPQVDRTEVYGQTWGVFG